MERRQAGVPFVLVAPGFRILHEAGTFTLLRRWA